MLKNTVTEGILKNIQLIFLENRHQTGHADAYSVSCKNRSAGFHEGRGLV